jgi:hypothetical protein
MEDRLMLADNIRVCCDTPANQPHLPDCDQPVEPLPEQQQEQGVDLDGRDD